MAKTKKMTVVEIFETLTITSSKIEILNILEQNRNNRDLRLTFEAALNPYKQYYIRKIPEYIPQPVETGMSYAGALRRLNHLGTKYRGNAAIDWLRKILESVNAGEALLIEKVIQKNMDCGVQTTTVNKIWHDLIPTFPCMLCMTYNEKSIANIQWPAIVQEKVDGMRVAVFVNKGEVEFRSRSGRTLDILGNMKEEFLKITPHHMSQGIVYDGELIMQSFSSDQFMKRKKGNGILNKAIKGTINEKEADYVRVVLFDVIPVKLFTTGEWEYPYIKRLNWLRNAVASGGDDVTKITIASTMEDVDSFFLARKQFDRITGRGGEGVIIKNVNSSWVGKRSKNQIKLKLEQDCDLVIKEVVQGTGKLEGLLGSFVCQTVDGLLEVSVGSGFNDADREAYFTDNMVGKIVSVKYNEKITDVSGGNSLFLPIFLEIRNDKTKADTLNDIK